MFILFSDIIRHCVKITAPSYFYSFYLMPLQFQTQYFLRKQQFFLKRFESEQHPDSRSVTLT